MAVITIDGRTIEVPKGKNVLECALDAGIYIPHLCHHKDLHPLGGCRMCIVQVEGQKTPVTSCTLKAEDGMVLHTQTEEIKKLRMLGLELLLAGHPEDCSTCPKYGHCELQMLIQYIGPKTGRLKQRTKGFTTDERNPLILHDMNRCILCGRCVRACKDLRGVGVLQFQKRDDLEVYTGTLQQKLLKDVNCRFCEACAEVCPTGTIRDILASSEVKKEDYIVPCRAECPAHTDIPRYIRFIKEGNFDAASAVIHEKLPFPKSLGYICTHVCELECKHNALNEPLSIRNLKRYAAEHDTGKYWKSKGKQLPDTGKKVCVVGGGPAGLTAAYYLRKQGHTVTIKEALPTAGGMLSYGIPAYRMPRNVVQEEINCMMQQGIDLECNTKVNNPAELRAKYDVVLMAIGGHVGVRLPIPGNQLSGVLLNIDFLRKAALEQETGIGKSVIVLGGGNVAFDCARTAKRLGAQEIHVACLEAREGMTADEEEIIQAEEEGILIHTRQTFEAITGEEYVTGVDFMNVESFSFDENRRAIIKKEEGSMHHITADTVIFATGQKPEISEREGLELGRANSIAVKDITKDKTTSITGIFAAGDCIYGTKSVIMAIESGREVASQIDVYLGGDGDISESLAPTQQADPYIGIYPGFAELPRKEARVDPACMRQDNFRVFDHGLCQSDACEEAERCLQCDLRLQISSPRTWGDFHDISDGKGDKINECS